jgi:hypothetical protein
MDPRPDPRSLAAEELKSLIKELIGKEQGVSDSRWVLHGQIDVLRRDSSKDFAKKDRTLSLGPTFSAPGRPASASRVFLAAMRL